jgi:GTP-binding protein YchF
MSLKCGIVGLPNVGKSTLFNALTSTLNAEASNYPFCTIEPNLGTVIVPDKRIDELVKIYNPKKIIPSTVEFVDIAGLVKGASKGEGLGNQFLSHIREVEAIVHIVRCFDDDNIIHVMGGIDPARDIEIVETELILKDIDTLDKRTDRISRAAKTGDKKLQIELDLINKLKEHLGQGRLAKYFTKDLTKDEEELIEDMRLLTDKPILYVANVKDTEIKGNKYTEIVKNIAAKESAEFMILSAEIESEIAQLPTKEEKQEFLETLGLSESGLDTLIRESYRLLGYITFFTAGEKEVHSWTIHKGLKAPEAAGKIHTDFEKGFIRAEVIKYDDVFRLKDEHLVREKGLMHIEGKDYVVEDGDIMLFRFNV